MTTVSDLYPTRGYTTTSYRKELCREFMDPIKAHCKKDLFIWVFDTKINYRFDLERLLETIFGIRGGVNENTPVIFTNNIHVMHSSAQAIEGKNDRTYIEQAIKISFINAIQEVGYHPSKSSYLSNLSHLDATIEHAVQTMSFIAKDIGRSVFLEYPTIRKTESQRIRELEEFYEELSTFQRDQHQRFVNLLRELQVELDEFYAYKPDKHHLNLIETIVDSLEGHKIEIPKIKRHSTVPMIA